MHSLTGSWDAYRKVEQALPWTGSVSAVCKASPFMVEMVKKMITNETADDIKFSRWFWKGAQALDVATRKGPNSKFAKFLGNKILGKLNIKVKVPKVKVHVKAKKPALKLKVKAKKPVVKAKAKAKVSVKAKAHHRRMQQTTGGVNADDPKFA